MLILALDTTSEAGGVGIFRDHECLAQVANEGPASGYSVRLFSMVDHVIEEAERRHDGPARGLADMGLIAVATGPGSFTGIRVGLAAAQGWAKAFGLPIRGITVLEALVEAGQVQTDWAVSILDARRGDFFVELFHRQPAGGMGNPASYLPAGEGGLLSTVELEPFFSTRLPQGAAVSCVVRGHDRAALDLRQSLSSSFRWQAVTGTLVEAIARLAFQNYRTGKPPGAGDLDARYIRRCDAESKWQR
jgi:tRNA threonylcarbamoyl adenosine modification protein YeaZ